MSLALSRSAAAPDPAIRVMVVDDAVVFRGLVTRWLAEEPDMQVVSSHRNGHEALENLLRVDPDVVVLDIEMPELDGFATLPRMLALKPELVVLIASTLTRRNAEIGIRALTLGAADYVGKPETSRKTATSHDFRRQLIEKIRGLGLRRSGRPVRQRAVLPPPFEAPQPEQPIALRPYSQFPPQVLVVGSSTGGPRALQSLLRNLTSVLQRLPVLIVQHMPPMFTAILAEHLGRVSGHPAHEAIDGERLQAGTLYISPGGRHMAIVRRGQEAKIVLQDGPPLHFCKPAVDPLFTSAAEAYGAGVLAVLLTGMGSDGHDGAARIAGAGGSVIAQDEATSVVWGMPGSAAKAGYCSGVLPLEAIAPQLVKLVTGGRP